MGEYVMSNIINGQTRYSYEDFTPAEMEALKAACSCGGKGSKIPVPEFMFHASCVYHDISYASGREESDRKRADKGFLRAMKRDVCRLPIWRRPLAYSAAYLYYSAVRLFGKKFFNYSANYATKEKIMMLCGAKKFAG